MDDLVMPLPTVDNLRKASADELAREVIELRKFVILLVLRMKDFMERKELPDAVWSRIAAAEHDAEIAKMTVQSLTEKWKEFERTWRPLISVTSSAD